MNTEITGGELSSPPQEVGFNGKGSEYFRIWIVNLLLSILTLGLYSAWAKVRRLQYFYRNTVLASSSFDYHGKPLAILKGRVIAVVLLLGYKYSFQWSPIAGGVMVVLLLVIAPWLMRSSFRFRMHNSSYRGLRFGFSGSLGDAYIAAYSGLLLVVAIGIVIAMIAVISKKALIVAGPAAALVLLFFVYPIAHRELKKYQHGHARYGQTGFSFSASLKEFCGVYAMTYLIAFGVLIAVGIVVAMLGLASHMSAFKPGSKPDPQALAGVYIVVFGIYGAMFLLIGPYFRSRIDNLIWNSTRLGPHAFNSQLTMGGLFAVYATNLLGIIFTLGLYWPWAMVRLARYRAATLSLIPGGSLDAFIAGQAPESSAIGEEAFSVFDIDIAL